ncbi:low affinity immunoglobulin gamma Fc region receptor II-like [Siniperca chuatsi]|uniref:low affinity immunoglobulin gamma Fc region receptor II-like n=1 Tax=Siniperca chuatsi TaxID=119488 RepID=UPI001CE0D38D|nr:low affinity immunoglobulin gamma Fc region receptor II-like [Siniperca chuatsi]
MLRQQQDNMEATALCIRLLTFVIILSGAHVQKSYNQKDDAAFRIVPNRLQVFEYESVSFHCEGLDGSTQLRGVRNYKEFITNCDFKRTSSTLTCTIQGAYDTDSGEYWCETERGEKSNIVNITVTAGSVILESPALPAMEGDNVTLRCRSKKHFTNLQADFYKDGLLTGSSSARETTIQNVSKSDEGLYKCSIPGVGESPGSWLAVRKNHPFHHRSSHVLVPLWVALILSVALVLLMLGFLHIREHRDSHSGEGNEIEEDTADISDSVTYTSVAIKQRKDKDKDESSLQPVYSTLATHETPQDLQDEEDTADNSDSVTYTSVAIKQRKDKAESQPLDLAAAKDSSLIEVEVLYSHVQKAAKKRDT